MLENRGVKSLQVAAATVVQLRDVLSKKKLTLSFADSLLDRAHTFQSLSECTAFLNHVHRDNYLSGNFFHEHAKKTLSDLREQELHLEDRETIGELGEASVKALEAHLAAKKAVTFYAAYTEAFNKKDPVYWRKLAYRLINREYIRQGCPEDYRAIMDDLAKKTNDHAMRDRVFYQELIKSLNKMDKIKSVLRLNDLFNLQQDWEEMSFLAHLSNADFIKAHKVFLEDRELFLQLKKVAPTNDKDVVEYLEHYAQFLADVEQAFVFAMSKRAQLKMLSKGNDYLLNPLLYVYEQLSSERFQFDAVLFPAMTHDRDTKRVTVYQVEDEASLAVCEKRHHERSSAMCYCYVKETKSLYKFIRVPVDKRIKIGLRDGVINTYLSSTSQETDVLLSDFIHLQQAFIHEPSMSPEECAAADAVIMSHPCADLLTDEQYLYFKEQAENYIVKQSGQLLNIQDVFENDAALIRKFRRFAAVAKKAANEVFDSETLLYPFEFTYDLLRDHEKVFHQKANKKFASAFRLKTFIEETKFFDEIDVSHQEPVVAAWLKKHINGYLLIKELDSLVDSASLCVSHELLEKMSSKMTAFSSAYLGKTTDRIVSGFLAERVAFYEKKHAELKQQQFQEDVSMLSEQLVTAYFQNTAAAFDKVLLLLRRILAQYEHFIAENRYMDKSIRPWRVALEAIVIAYQKNCIADGGLIKDPGIMLFVYQKMQALTASQSDDINRLQFHLQKNAQQFLQGDRQQIIKLIEANTSLDYRSQKSVLQAISVTQKKTAVIKKYVVPKALEKWLTGSDLDKRIDFMEGKKATFQLMDDGFKAASALLGNDFIGFSDSNFHDALAKIRSALNGLKKEQAEVIEMNFFDKAFFHQKTWEIKNAWKRESAHYAEQLKSDYHAIINKAKKALMADLTAGYFNYKLYQLCEEAMVTSGLPRDVTLGEKIRDAVLSFPFKLTKRDDMTALFADKEYLASILRYVDRYFSTNERIEYYNLLLDCMLQGLLAYSSMIDDVGVVQSLDVSLQLPERQLTLMQMKNAVLLLKEKLTVGDVALDFERSSFMPSIKAFIHNEKMRLTESSKNDVIIILSDLLALDSKANGAEIEAIQQLVEKRKENDAIIDSARHFAESALGASKELRASLDQALQSLSASQQALFKDVYQQVLSPYLKYLLDLSTDNVLVDGLLYEKNAPKSQLLLLLENDLIVDDVQRLTIYKQLFKQIASKSPLDFFDKRILTKMAQLKLQVSDLSVSLDELIHLIERSSEQDRAFYLDVAVHSTEEISQSILNDHEEDSWSNGKRALFVYHLERLSLKSFHSLYIATQPFDKKILSLLDQGFQETFKEAYRFKEILSLFDKPTVAKRVALREKLTALASSGISLRDYLGEDNVVRLVNFLSDQCHSFELSLRHVILPDAALPAAEEADMLLLFDQHLPELSAVFVEKSQCCFGDTIAAFQQHLLRLTKTMPLLKALQASVQHPGSLIKLQGCVSAILASEERSEEDAMASLSIASLVRDFLTQMTMWLPQTTNEGDEDGAALDTLLGDRVNKAAQSSLLEKNAMISKAVYFEYFQKIGLQYVEEQIDRVDTAAGGLGFAFMFTLRKHDLLRVMFGAIHQEGDSESIRHYQAQFERVSLKIEAFLLTQTDAILALDKIDCANSSIIGEWLQDEFALLQQQLTMQASAINAHHVLRLMTFYLKHKESFPLSVIASIDAILEKNTRVVEVTLLPCLHPNSPLFLVDQSTEDKKGMAMKMNREQHYQENALRAMMYQLMYPEKKTIKDSLRMLKSAYLARGISDDGDAVRFDQINAARTENCVFRYNAFEAFTKEPLNKVFFREDISPLVAFLGSYRTAKQGQQAEQWKEKIAELFSRESLLSRLLANWYTFLYESRCSSAGEVLGSNASLYSDQHMKQVLSLFHATPDVVQKTLRELFFNNDAELLAESGLVFDDSEGVYALLSTHNRLLAVSQLVFSISHTLPVLQQKQLFVVGLLKLSLTNQDKEHFLNLALSELQAMSLSNKGDACFDLSGLKKHDIAFLRLFYPEKERVSGVCSVSSLMNTLHDQKAYGALHEAYHIAKYISGKMTALEREVIEYFCGQLSSENDKRLLRERFIDGHISAFDFESKNVQKKFLIACDMLKRIKQDFFLRDLSKENSLHAIDHVISAVVDAKQEMQQQKAQSRQFAGILDQYYADLSGYRETMLSLFVAEGRNVTSLQKQMTG